MAARVLVDTGFWFALWDIRDGDKQHPHRHHKAAEIAEALDFNEFALPWPTIYETLCTRFVGQRKIVESFLLRMERPNHIKLEDGKYRDAALSEVRFAIKQKRKLSMVDAVLRQMLQDKTLRLQGTITFNVRDFSDICYPLGIQIYPDPAD